jgi:CBS domain-containing protein
MKNGEFCNRDVIMINGDESVKRAAELMRKNHVGDVVVVEELHGKRTPIGIITDRDLVIEVMASGLDASELAIQDIVTRSVLTANEDDSLFNTLELMREKGVRRIPVVDINNTVAGIITLDDITALLSKMLYSVVGVIESQNKNEKKLRT